MNQVASVTKLITLRSVGACYQCGIQFAFDSEIVERRIQDGKSFYCPNGHIQAFCESEVTRLKKQLESKEKQLSNEKIWSEQYRKDRDSARKQTAAFKGVVTRTRNRIKNGVCPCCKRTFQNLLGHMKIKHPSYGSDE